MTQHTSGLGRTLGWFGSVISLPRWGLILLGLGSMMASAELSPRAVDETSSTWDVSDPTYSGKPTAADTPFLINRRPDPDF
jgi:hypothetical protein